MMQAMSLTQAVNQSFFVSAVALLMVQDVPVFAVALDLRVGIAQHAFDHLGNIGNQADAAAASGSTIIYVSGMGALGYSGLPPEPEFTKAKTEVESYIANARKKGIQGAIGYVCATSIVKLGGFDKNWPDELRRQLHTPPSHWLQQDKNGEPLPSWYGGDYAPACMNNPDWRRYEKYIVRQQLEAGCDGIFFDNPTVHPQGCYCEHCMERFLQMLLAAGTVKAAEIPEGTNRLAFQRNAAAAHNQAFLGFRCRVAAEFFKDIRDYAHSIKRDALITANNSLNAQEVLFAQCRNYAYNIYEMSKTEDYVVVEDMGGMPRTLPNGQLHEYAPTYKLLNAISHGKPVVAVTLAEADYHTPPNLVCLAMAEAAANGASYMSWPTWPENQRQRLIEGIRPEANFLRTNAELFAQCRPRADVLLFLPFRNWLKTGDCQVYPLARELSARNIQYKVFCEDDFAQNKTANLFKDAKVLLVARNGDLQPDEERAINGFTSNGGVMIAAEEKDWLKRLSNAVPPSVIIDAKTLRASVWDGKKTMLAHLLNLGVQRRSSFEDTVTPLSDLTLSLRSSLVAAHSVRLFTPDEAAPRNLQFEAASKGGIIKVQIPRVRVSALLVVE